MSPGASLEMSLAQRLVAYAAILMFGLPSLLVALLGGEAWPFLDYRMYAEAKFVPEVDWLALRGRTDDGGTFSLDDESYIAPFAYSELLRALYTLDVLNEGSAAAPARRALRGLLAAYEQNRLAGEHDGPRLAALEVYRVRWRAHAGGAYDAMPDSHRLLQTVTLTAATP